MRNTFTSTVVLAVVAAGSPVYAMVPVSDILLSDAVREVRRFCTGVTRWIVCVKLAPYLSVDSKRAQR